MKVYVDELPKKCIDCPCYDCELACCNISSVDLQIDENFNRYKQIHKDCPIQTISDHDKQVRKQVCDEIKEFLENHKYKVFGDYNHQTLQYNETYICELLEINKFLDQIEKGK